MNKCKDCKNICWDDNNGFHVCYQEAIKQLPEDRKRITLNDSCEKFKNKVY